MNSSGKFIGQPGMATLEQQSFVMYMYIFDDKKFRKYKRKDAAHVV